MAALEDAPQKTRASEALRTKFDARHGAQKDCFLRTGIAQTRLSRIADGKAFPRADEGSLLVEEGIPIHWWNEKPLDEEPAPDPDHPANATPKPSAA